MLGQDQFYTLIDGQKRLAIKRAKNVDVFRDNDVKFLGKPVGRDGPCWAIEVFQSFGRHVATFQRRQLIAARCLNTFEQDIRAILTSS